MEDRIQALEISHATIVGELKDLRNLVAEGFMKIDRNFETVHRRFEEVDRNFETVHRRFEEVDQNFKTVHRRFEEVDQNFETVHRKFKEVDQNFEIVQKTTTSLQHQLDLLNNKVDSLKSDTVAGLHNLGSKIDHLTEEVAKIGVVTNYIEQYTNLQVVK